MLSILGMIILLIILFIIIILLAGIRLQIQWVKTDDEIDGYVKILILKKLKVYTFDLKSDDQDGDRDPENLLELAKPCLSDLTDFLKKALKEVKINRLENHLVIGFSNFAKTGEYIGYIWAILAVLNTAIPNSHLSAEPSFKGEVLNLTGIANLDIYILKLIKPLIELLLKKEVRILIKGVLNG